LLGVLRNAKSELDKVYQTARQQTFPADETTAITYLLKADILLEKSLAIVDSAD
jgi:hypothetical protein